MSSSVVSEQKINSLLTLNVSEFIFEEKGTPKIKEEIYECIISRFMKKNNIKLGIFYLLNFFEKPTKAKFYKCKRKKYTLFF